MFGFPLLLIPLAIFNIIVFLMPGVVFTAPVIVVRLMSGTDWTVTLGDLLLALAMLMLLFEAIKVARNGGRFLTDHLLSLIVLCAATAEFLLLAPFGNSTYFLLCVLCFVDFTVGLALHRRRRAALAVGASPAPAPVQPSVDTAEAFPHVDDAAPVREDAAPAASPAAPSAASPSLPDDNGILKPSIDAAPSADPVVSEADKPMVISPDTPVEPPKQS